jgi:LPS O-antigen subunit length determinant protein (WzzB/FepE family)
MVEMDGACAPRAISLIAVMNWTIATGITHSVVEAEGQNESTTLRRVTCQSNKTRSMAQFVNVFLDVAFYFLFQKVF